MSEESKTPEGDYVMMGAGGAVPSLRKPDLNLDDPNLTQEEKDHRLAIAMQQQENAAAYNEHKKKHEAKVTAEKNRTTRSGTFTKLAAVRQKDHGMLSVPSEYSNEHAYTKDFTPSEFQPPINAQPEEVADFKLAAELQKVEQVGAGTVRTMQQMVEEEEEADKSQNIRTARSKNTL